MPDLDPGASRRSDVALDRVAVLGDPMRRALYRYVMAQDEPVSRDQAAAATSVARHVAKFHLDKLEAEGLLAAEYHRPAGRGGPGAGRPTKFYRRTGGDIAVSLPQRHYELAGRVLAAAIAAAQDGTPLDQALSNTAFRAGQGLVSDQETGAIEQGVGGCPLEMISTVLGDYGYRPQTAGNVLRMTSCPFQELAREFPALACGLNLDLVRGLIDQLQASPVRVELNPDHSGCCVVVTSEAG